MLKRNEAIAVTLKTVKNDGRRKAFATLEEALDGVIAAHHLGFPKISLMVRAGTEGVSVDGDSVFDTVAVTAVTLKRGSVVNATIRVDGKDCLLDSVTDLLWVISFT